MRKDAAGGRHKLQRLKEIVLKHAIWLLIAWWTGGIADEDDESPDPIESAAATDPGPDARLESAEAMQRLEAAIGRLPARQAEAFMLRSFEGLDVAETARAMGCSEGSVKTHHVRATQALRAELGEHWP